MSPIPATACYVRQILLVERVTLRADETERLHRCGDSGRPVGYRSPPQQPGVDPGLRLAHAPGTRGRHHQRERANPIGVLQRDGLRDEPAHRRPDEMDIGQRETIEKTDHVSGHVADLVGRRPVANDHVDGARRRNVPHVG
jgi:hypothetical protein